MDARAHTMIAGGVLAAIALVAGAADPDAGPGPRLVVEAPASLEDEARRIRQLDPERLGSIRRLVGLANGGAPIRVILAPEDAEAARTAPAWVSGYAYGSLGVVVLLPARTPNYPDSSLEELLRHEVAHVLIARAAANRPVPRWFNEGLAMTAADLWGLDDRSRLSWSLLTRNRYALEEVGRMFGEERGAVGRAYAVSGALVRFLLQRHGPEAAAGILSRVALGQPFEIAFGRSTGEGLDRFTAAFWKRHSVWYRWVPILTSSFTLWVGITLLALVAGVRRRKRDAALRELWEAEERLLEAEPEETVN